ncbi:MAG: hypothetical protein ACYSUQ_06890, partial [Planctomycetota bacterium]
EWSVCCEMPVNAESLAYVILSSVLRRCDSVGSLLQYVYGVASAKGSHHGVADGPWSCLARRMVLTTGQYVILHYEAWKSGGRARPDRSAPGADPPRRRCWRGILGRLKFREAITPRTR